MQGSSDGRAGTSRTGEESGGYEFFEPQGEVEEKLPLPGDDERLPWLEAHEEYEEDSVGGGRLFLFVLVAMLVLALILGAWWWMSGQTSGTQIAPDGSTIEAPDEPYKTRPEDPGGRQVEGTGDESFSVAEGERTEARVAIPDAPRPSIDRDQQEAPAVQEAPAEEDAASLPGVGVQVGAFSTRSNAQNAWWQFRNRFSGLKDLDHRILEGRADSGTIYRLQAVTFSVSEAESLCRSIKAEGGDCQVKR
jgi:hypothetical protein